MDSSNSKKSYASVSKNFYTTTKVPSESKKRNSSNNRKKFENSPDHRLILRLSEDNSLQYYSGFKLLSYIKS